MTRLSVCRLAEGPGFVFRTLLLQGTGRHTGGVREGLRLVNGGVTRVVSPVVLSDPSLRGLLQNHPQGSRHLDAVAVSVRWPVTLLGNWLSLLSVRPSPATASSRPVHPPDWRWALKSALSLVGNGGRRGQSWGRSGPTREGFPVEPWFAQGCLRSSSMQEVRGGQFGGATALGISMSEGAG